MKLVLHKRDFMNTVLYGMPLLTQSQIICLNQFSFRLQGFANQKAGLMPNPDLDVVFGCKSIE